ncbi:hypothetical protein A45J_1706 [hot springs metagenome]|uniref:Uncharacterized protein n=1 Tax=hot springs metagenome TaxID=433727 RepID=A0A5J4KWK6_9ZZZZ
MIVYSANAVLHKENTNKKRENKLKLNEPDLKIYVNFISRPI